MTDLSNPIYHDNNAARRYLEAIRWPDGPYCPHCGVFDSVQRLGGKAKNRAFGPPPKKEAVFALVEREGKVHSFHVPAVNARSLRPILVTHADRDSYLMTDEAGAYVRVGREYSGHGTVNHSINEYVRGGFWYTNTVENYFSILKRGISGVYQHVSQQHLKRYLGEFDFRYNERDAQALAFVVSEIELAEIAF